MREQVLQIVGGRTFKAEKTASAKALRLKQTWPVRGTSPECSWKVVMGES